MNNPEYVKVDNELYKINTDFRVAIECNNIAKDTTINDYERALGIIYKLFGEKGLECNNQDKLLELAVKYLSLGNTIQNMDIKQSKKFELDFNKCEGIIGSRELTGMPHGTGAERISGRRNCYCSLLRQHPLLSRTTGFEYTSLNIY